MSINQENFIFDTAFIQKVYDAVAKIPAGKVATYGQIAEMAGDEKAAREVGVILSRVTAEQKLPCHRVVNRTGTLAPEYVFGGQKKQRAMLEAEGITFLKDERVNMNHHTWGMPEQMMLDLG